MPIGHFGGFKFQTTNSWILQGIVKLLSSSLPGQAIFFANYITVQSLVTYPIFFLTRLPDFLLCKLKHWFTCKTKRERKEAEYPDPPFDYAVQYARETLVFAIALTYSSMGTKGWLLTLQHRSFFLLPWCFLDWLGCPQSITLCWCMTSHDTKESEWYQRSSVFCLEVPFYTIWPWLVYLLWVYVNRITTECSVGELPGQLSYTTFSCNAVHVHPKQIYQSWSNGIKWYFQTENWWPLVSFGLLRIVACHTPTQSYALRTAKPIQKTSRQKEEWSVLQCQ